MSYESHSFGSWLSYRPAEHPTKLSIKRILYLAWLMFLAMAIYAFPLYGAIYPAEGTWFDSEQFWFSLIVVSGWPIAAFYIIRWQWRASEDPSAHCERCGRELPDSALHCPACAHSEAHGLTTERMGALMLTQRISGNA